jgi:hypothetical protein
MKVKRHDDHFFAFIIFSTPYASYHAPFGFPHFLSHFQPEARLRFTEMRKKGEARLFLEDMLRLGNPDDLQLTATRVWLF